MMAAPVTLPPCLIRETLYAPPCPPPAAALFDTGLTLQNEGKFAFAINATLQAQQAWEQSLLEEHYPDIEDKVAHSILLRLRQNEKLESEAASEAKRLAEMAEAELALRDEEELLRQMDALSGESDDAADARLAAARASRASKIEGEKTAAAAGANSKQDSNEQSVAMDPNTIFLQQQQEKMRLAMEDEARRRAEDEAAAQVKFNKERERKRKEKVSALHQVYQMLSIEGKIFIQLRLSSIFESAGDDEKALAAALHALKFVQTLPVHTDHTLKASVYASLGTIYAHLAQYDYAGDYYFKALEIRESNLDTEHVDTATTMHNVGCILQFLQKPNDALVCYYKALDVFKRLLPPSHPRVGMCESNIRKAKELQFNKLVVPPVPMGAAPKK